MKLLERRVYVANVDPFVKWFGEMNIDEPNSLSSFANLGVWQLALRLVRTPKASLHIVRQCISELPKRCTPWNYFPSWQIITSQLDLQMETSSKKKLSCIQPSALWVLSKKSKHICMGLLWSILHLLKFIAASQLTHLAIAWICCGPSGRLAYLAGLGSQRGT